MNSNFTLAAHWRAAFIALTISTAFACGGSTPEDASPPKSPATTPAASAPSQSAASAPGARATTGASIDACSLVTKAEVEAVLKQPVQEPAKSQDGNITNCKFGTFWVSLTTGSDVATAKQDHEFNKTVTSAAQQAVPGLGDDAFWNERVQGLWVLAGANQFSIQRAPNVQAATELARKALERLR
jgi:hypothetical protein